MWAAEDIEAVFDQDPQRVCILQGPVAAKWSTVKDEPVKELLGNINKGLIDRLLERKYAGDKSAIPTIDYLAAQPTTAPTTTAGVTRKQEANAIVYQIGSKVPDADEWLSVLGGSGLTWINAFISSTTIIRGNAYIDNPVRRILSPRPNQKVVVKTGANGVPISVAIYGAARSYGEHIPDFKALEIVYKAETKAIDLTLFEERTGSSIPLSLKFKYVPSQGFAPIHEVEEGRNRRIKQFYWKLWYGDNEELPTIDVHETFVGPEVTINADDVEQFCSVVGNQGEAFKTVRTEDTQAPMDFAIVTGWQVCGFKSL